MKRHRISIFILMSAILFAGHQFTTLVNDFSQNEISPAMARRIRSLAYEIHNFDGTTAVGQTAWAIDKDLLVTVTHGLSKESQGLYNLNWSVKSHDGHFFKVKVVMVDYQSDILLMRRIGNQPLVSATIADRENSEIFLVDILRNQPRLINGNWSAWIKRYDGRRLASMKASGQSGNSGAPVTNAFGEIEGMWWGEIDIDLRWYRKTLGSIIDKKDIQRIYNDYITI